MIPPEATGIANNLYIQFGAASIVMISGWVVAWQLWRRLLQTQDKYDQLSREVITQAAALNETARDMIQMKELKELIKESLRD